MKCQQILSPFLVFSLSTQLGCSFEDFTKCSESITGLDCTNKDSFCPNGQFPLGFRPQNPALTVSGCYRRCGRNSGPLPLKEPTGMMSIWLVPFIFLIGSFHFPDLGKRNTILAVQSLISNPVGSMWSVLTRMEAYRRVYRMAIYYGFSHPEDVATVAAACDEIGWHNPLPKVIEQLSLRQTTESSPEGPGSALDETEIALFAQARNELISPHNNSQWPTWLAIIGLIGSLIVAFVKAVTAEQRKYVPHIISVMALAFYLITLV